MNDGTLTIPARFNGPPDSGNGGYTCGMVAAALGDGPAEVMLKAPPPLDRALAIARDHDGVVLRDGETEVARGDRATIDVEPPAPVAFEAAATAGAAGPFVDPARHPFPTCFVCGPARAEGDGLRIFAGPVDDEAVFAAAWTPAADLAGPDGGLPPELVWAALDCPTSGPVANDPDDPDFKPIVLARLGIRIDRPVIAGEPHVVIAWPVAVDGRKRHAGAALYDARGELCAVSRALWIELRSS